jgi:hypothetical protein
MLFGPRGREDPGDRRRARRGAYCVRVVSEQELFVFCDREKGNNSSCHQEGKDNHQIPKTGR